MEEFLTQYAYCCPWIQTIAACAAGFFIWLTLYKRNNWNKKKYTLDIFNDWSSYFQPCSTAIGQRYPKLHDPNLKRKEDVMPQEAVKKFIRSAHKPDRDFRAIIIKTVNKIEWLCVAFYNDAVDVELFEKEAKFTIIHWYKLLGAFMDEESEHMDGSMWPNFVRLAKRFQRFGQN